MQGHAHEITDIIEDETIVLTKLVNERIVTKNYDLDSLLALVNQASKIEIFTYIDNPGNLLHLSLILLDNSLLSSEKLIEFMTGFTQRMGKKAMHSLVNSDSVKNNILHVLAERPRLACLFPLLSTYFINDELPKKIIALNDKQRSPCHLILWNRNVPLFDNVIKQLGETGKVLLKKSINTQALELLFHTTTEFERQLEQAFCQGDFLLLPTTRKAENANQHAALIIEMLDRIANIYSAQELSQQALATDNNGQNSLILSCYIGDELLIKRCLDLYVSDAYRRQAITQPTKLTAANSLHMISAFGRIESLQLFLDILGSEALQTCCRVLRSTKSNSSIDGSTALHCCYLIESKSELDYMERAAMISKICNILGNELPSLILRDRKKFLLHTSLESDGIIIKALLELKIEQPRQSELLFALICLTNAPRRDAAITARPRASSILTSNSPIFAEKPVESNTSGLWHRFASLAHLRQAGLRTADSNELFMTIETAPETPNAATENNTALQANVSVNLTKQQDNPLLSKLLTKLLGIEYPAKILNELIQFIREQYSKNKFNFISFNECIVPKLSENLIRKSDDNIYWLLTALHCASNEEYRKVCEAHISHFAAKLALMFLSLDSQQNGLSSKVIAATYGKDNLLAVTLFKEFNLSEQFVNEESYEIAVRLKTVFFASEKINADLIADLAVASDSQIYHQINGINILNLFLQHAHQFMVAMSQFSDSDVYRAHVVLLTRELFNKLGPEKLKILVMQKTSNNTNIFHLLAILKEINFLLVKITEILDINLVKSALCETDRNNATPFHYACFYRNTTFVEFIIKHAQQHKYVSALQEAGARITDTNGHNVLHLINLPRENDISTTIDLMKTVITFYGVSGEALALKKNLAGHIPLAQCCLNGDTKLITAAASAFQTAEGKFRAIGELIQPSKPDMNVAPLQAIFAFTETIAPQIECIDILYYLLAYSGEYPQQIIAEKSGFTPKTRSVAPNISPPPRRANAAPISPSRLKAPATLLKRNTPLIQKAQAQTAASTVNDIKLAEFKRRMVKHFLGFNCSDEIYQCLIELVAKCEAHNSAADSNYVTRLVPFILTGLVSLSSLNSKIQAVLNLAAHISTTNVSSSMIEKITQYCIKNKEIFAASLLQFNHHITLQSKNAHFQIVGKIFAHPTLLRSMICASFDILDESITSILAQWDNKKISVIAQIKNSRNQNLLEALLAKLATSKEGSKEIAKTMQHFCEFAGIDLIAQLAKNHTKEASPLMSTLAKHAKLQHVAPLAATWLEPIVLKQQLLDLNVLKQSCKNLSIGMLCFLNDHLETATIEASYPSAKNILHAVLLCIAQFKTTDTKSIIYAIANLLKQLGTEKTQKLFEENLSDGRKTLEIIAALPKLNFLLPVFEELIDKKILLGQSVLPAICEHHNTPMLFWHIKLAEGVEPPIDINTPIQTICANNNVQAFTSLCNSIGNDNVKALINSMNDNVLQLICLPGSADGNAVLKLFNSPWVSSAKSEKIVRQDQNNHPDQSRLLTAVTALYDTDELNSKALACDTNRNNAFMLACCTGDTTLIQQCFKLYNSIDSQRAACLQANGITEICAIHIASAFCSLDVLRTIITTLGDQASTLCALRLKAFGYQNSLDCYYLSVNALCHNHLLQFLCETLATQLITAVIRPLTFNVPSLIEISVNQDKIILNNLLKLDLSHYPAALVMEISRRNAQRIDAMAELQGPRVRYQPTSPRSSKIDTPILRGRSVTMESHRRRGNTLPEGQLPLPMGRGGSISPRKPQPPQQITPSSITREEILNLLQRILGIRYPEKLLHELQLLIQTAYSRSDVNEDALLRILTNDLTVTIFNDEKALIPCIVLSSIITIDITNKHCVEAFIEKCRSNALIFVETLSHLMQQFDEGIVKIKNDFIKKLLTGNSLLRKSIVACFEIPEKQMQNEQSFLDSLQANSVKPLEQKLANYLEAVDQHDADSLFEPNMEKEGLTLLHIICRELATYEMTKQRVVAVTSFMSTLLEKLKQKQALDVLALHQSNDKENILHYLACRKTMNFLITPLRETLSQSTFSQMLTTTDNQNNTPLHIACAAQQTHAFAEMLAGASLEALSAISRITTSGESYNLLHLACISHRQQPAIEVQAICEGQKTISAKTLPRDYLANIDVSCAIGMVKLLIKHLSKEDVVRMSMDRDYRGNTAFLLCCYTGDSKLLNVISSIYTTNTENLHAASTILPPLNVTPLQIVCAFGSINRIEITLEMLSTNLISAYLTTSSLWGRAVESCEFTSSDSSTVTEIVKVLALELSEHLDEIIDLNINYVPLINILRRGITEQNLTKLCNKQGDHLLLIFLRKLITSGLTSNAMQAEYTKFCEALSENITSALLRQPNKKTANTVMHLLASEKTLIPLLSVFNNLYAHKQLCELFTINQNEMTPLQIACRNPHLEFIRFSNAIGKKSNDPTLFHLLITSYYTENIWRIKAILEGAEAQPDQPLSRWLLREIVDNDDIHHLFTELVTICGESIKALLEQPDQNGNTVLMLLCYLNNPNLLNSFIIATQFDFDFLSKIATQSLPKTGVTPLQMLAAFGSAASLKKLISMLGETARTACLQTNKYLGGRNALACCYYLSTINHTNDKERLAMQQILSELMEIIPTELEKALIWEMSANIVPTLTLSITRDQCLAREIILGEILVVGKIDTLRNTDFLFPVELLVDTLFEPNDTLTPPTLTYTDEIGPLMKVNDLRNRILKRICIISFIPEELLEAMVELVSAARTQLNLSDRKLILLTLLTDNSRKIELNDRFKNYALLFLAAVYPVPLNLSTAEKEYCTLFMQNTNLMIDTLRDFIVFLNQSTITEELGNEFLHKIYQEDSLLRAGICTVFKDKFDKKDLRDENLFIARLQQILAKPTTTKAIIGWK